jgi:hypothetical protein
MPHDGLSSDLSFLDEKLKSCTCTHDVRLFRRIDHPGLDSELSQCHRADPSPSKPRRPPVSRLAKYALWKRKLVAAAYCAMNPRMPFEEPPPDRTEVSFAPMASVEEETGRLEASQVRGLRSLRSGYHPIYRE